MTEHTPVPWEVIGRSIYQTEAVGRREVVHGSGIKGRDSEDRSRQDVINEAKANARFIVTACNCYEKLVQALEEHSIYFLATNGEELFDQPLNWEAILLQEIREAEDQFNAS